MLQGVEPMEYLIRYTYYLTMNTCHLLWKWLGIKGGCHCICLIVKVQNALTELARWRKDIRSWHFIVNINICRTRHGSPADFGSFAMLSSHPMPWLPPAAPFPTWVVISDVVWVPNLACELSWHPGAPFVASPLKNSKASRHTIKTCPLFAFNVFLTPTKVETWKCQHVNVEWGFFK